MTPRIATIALASAGAVATPAHAGPQTAVEFFPFADVNFSYFNALPPGDPLVGLQVVSVRFLIDLHVNAGSDAANLNTNIALPISTPAGDGPFVIFLGSDLGFSGSGDFSHEEETTAYNGHFTPMFYAAETFGLFGNMSSHSGAYVTYLVPAPGVTVLALSAAAFTCRRRR